MSYSIRTTEPVKVDGVQSVFTLAQPQTDPDGVEPYYEVHKDAAFKAVTELAKAIGGVDSYVTFNVSGHANPGHAASLGWADECINITVNFSNPPEVKEEVVAAPKKKVAAVKSAKAEVAKLAAKKSAK